MNNFLNRPTTLLEFFLDDLKERVLYNNKNEPCECCGIYNSEGVFNVTDVSEKTSYNLRLCEDCFLEIKRVKNPRNLAPFYDICQEKN
jgi:hypothetical protein